MNTENFEEDVIIAIAELNDQFSVITDIEIIEKTEKALMAFNEKYKNNGFYAYDTYFFKATREDFNYLKSNLADTLSGQDNIREWIEEHS